MSAATAPTDRATLLAQARDPQATPFDYIVIGSGAGGGPLAARLAKGGRRVLVLEAGVDASMGPDGKPLPIQPGDNTSGGMRQVAVVPAFHGAATEDAQMSWTFSVRHYNNDARQQRDTKYTPTQDPSRQGGLGQGGIQYPRTAAIGGCTAHYAMIIIRPNDADWDWIANRTNDPSWRSDHMQGYFPKIEKCLYYGVYNTFGRKTLGTVLTAARKVATFINPRRQLDPGGHGEKGWLPTSFIDPLVIASIVKGDNTFLRVLLDVALSTLGGKDERGTFLRSLAHLQLLQFLDPNVRSPDLPSRAHLSLISIGTDGHRRFGLREHLLQTQKDLPEHLVIETGVHVTRVVFAPGASATDPPRAIGVELLQGAHLYRASPLAGATGGTATRLQLFARQEVIVCGGAFNSPQVLMLSGIGDRQALEKLKIEGPRDRHGQVLAPIVHLPGVGRHMQDRYEVSVISEATRDFSTLKGVSFTPDTPGDQALQQWLKDGSGLYSTNGGALALMMSSTANQAVRRDPDLFIFGVPAAFRGYYWGYSKEVLYAHKGSGKEQRNLWSWVILKAYTHNRQGSVTLRTADPLDVPQIDFHSFDEGDDAPHAEGAREDADALSEAITRMREINQKITVFGNEVQPGPGLPAGPALDQWIRDEAWGHHACGTCRIGADRWQADTATLTEPDAVLSSDFRVHGVSGLRVVDASVFPRIPGYFIVTPTYMIGEKAADVLLADSPDYPRALRAAEAGEIRLRRAAAGLPPVSSPVEDELPADTVGLALSGGGVRSATFCLGVLQALAMRGRLRQIDMVSSVSGGGYTGAFLGRLFTRQEACVEDKAGRVASILATPSSPEVWWLRKHANYIDSGSRTDLQNDLAIVLRNLAFVHLWIGALVFGLFGLARWLIDGWAQTSIPDWRFQGIGLSPWWPLPVLVLLLGVVPTASGYWFVLKDPHEGRDVLRPLWLWVALLACAVFALGVPSLLPWGALALVVLLLAWTAQEMASWGIPDDDPERARRGPLRSETSAPPTPPSTIIRTRLSRVLGSLLFGFALAVFWVVLDSLARAAGEGDFTVTGWSMLVLPPLLALLRSMAMQVLSGKPAPLLPSGPLLQQLLLSGIAFGLLFLLLFYLDAMVHWAFRWPHVGPWLVVSTLLASLAVARIFPFLNLSSLQAGYAQKLVRNFLGASNDARVHPPGVDAPIPINISDPGDDIDFDLYRPQDHGGPLHLIGACVNDTVDRNSGRQLRDDKGLSLCVGPAGLSVGRRHHALWVPRDPAKHKTPMHRVGVTPVLVAPDPNQFHVLARRDDQAVEVERLKLGQWTAISGAAYTTGLGRGTTLAKSLLLGLLNIRIGYWWDSGVPADQRPGRFPPGLWRRIKSLPGAAFRLQATLLDEWRAWFPGASSLLWYLSDGGHFDNTGLYELIRRRLPFMVAVDASQDEAYQFDDLALLTRQVRLDFNATIEWLEPAQLHSEVPAWIARQVDLGAIGALTQLKREGGHYAALARVVYHHQPSEPSWLLLIKPSLCPDIPTDVRYYAQTHPVFPQQSTADQFFDDDQWEAYRMLGQHAGLSVFLR